MSADIYPRIHQLLTRAGHDPGKAAVLLLEAMCGDDRALSWIKLVFRSRHNLRYQ
jgi:hypothetical protein